MDDYCAGEDGDIGKRVTEIVNEDAAQIEVAPPADESEGDAAIDGESGDGGPDHPALDHGHGGAEALESFIPEPERKQDEDEGVGERSKRAGAVIAVGLFAIGGPFGPAHREIGNAERGEVGKIANRVVEKGDAAAENAAKDLRHNQTESGSHGPAKHGGAQRGVSVAGVSVAGGTRMTRVTVVVGMSGHPLYSTGTRAAGQPFPLLVRQYDTSPPRID